MRSVTLYLLAGILWASWQLQSRFARQVAEAEAQNGRSWTILVGIFLGAILWPLGPIGYFVFWIKARKNKE